MAFYRRHVFVCENYRESGECCCNGGNAVIEGGAVKYMRALLKETGEHGKGRVRVNRAGCFDRCREGPVLVVYPQGRWYRYRNADDLQEIVRQEILDGKPVSRLQI